jgi:two-component system chemotaxis response regulator CheY
MPVAKKRAAVISTPTDPIVMTLLDKISEGKHVMSVLKGEMIFSQGDHADAIYFIQSGMVKVSVVSSAGKAAVLAMLGPDAFFGEESLVGHPLRLSTATALEPLALFRVETRAMLRALRDQPDLSRKFMAVLLTRKVDLDEDLCDQLFRGQLLYKVSGRSAVKNLKSRILIVDDSSMSRRIVRGILESAGHEVTEAADGMAALERYSLEKPDLVVLDMVMTGMYGVEVLQKLREIDGQARIIVATADIQHSTREMAEQAGSRGFLNKPIKKEELLTIVSSVLEEGH